MGMPPPPPPRVEYSRGELRREDLAADAIEQFATWFQQAASATASSAAASAASQLSQPDAMSLATVSAEGQPSLRTVLLKSYDSDGFVFFTNLESRKARDIAENPRVALMFAWLPLERQVIVTGTAERLSTMAALRYFLTRPRGSQIAAWISRQSQPISSRAVLEMEWDTMSRKFASGQVPLPSFWGGYRIKPQRIEFWQGRVNRLHDRFLYTRQSDGSWAIDRLAP
jgi:pyridoxamine 5'-phosphate oxidase